MTSVFTKIIQGELPCFKVHEDNYTISFLPIEPIQLGHTLVVPKQEVDHFIDVEDPYYTQVFKNAKFIGKAIYEVVQPRRVGSIIQGFEVPHFHLHLVPMFDPSDLDFRKAKKHDPEIMQTMAEKLQRKVQEFMN